MAERTGGPATFTADAVAGFAAAYGRYVQPVPNASAVMRSGGPVAGKVAVIGGGGSGHYPAFMGLVGSGLLDAAVIGEVFTSPSAEQAYRTGRSLDTGAGVLFSYGNYAGDRLNFGLAQDRLRAAGIDCQTVVVTDDVASGDARSRQRRRGVAGDLVVFKVAGAAAERGLALAEVEWLARLANDRTSTIGVAFGGCTLPGAGAPLFTVEDGMIEVGLGIHGEAGVRTMPRPGPDELAALMVGELLAERPAGARRAAVLLNGLGATKYEELFGLWSHIHVLLADNDVEPVAPEVGELVTSLDMPGCSLTVTWLDDELERMWLAPADTPAFRRQDLSGEATSSSRKSGRRRDRRTAPAFPDSRTLGTTAVDATTLEMAAWDPAARIAQLALAAMLAAVQANETELGRLDAVAGDGDHGSGMVRGLTAATSAAFHSAASGATLGPVLREAGAAWADRAGGTSGVLWGLLLSELGGSLAGLDPPETADVAAAVGRAWTTISNRGGAKLGDKTMLDALAPFAHALRRAAQRGDDLPRAWQQGAIAAAEGARATAGFAARAGRAEALAARASGSPDPGAISMSICIEAVSAVLSEHCATTDRQEHA